MSPNFNLQFHYMTLGSSHFIVKNAAVKSVFSNGWKLACVQRATYLRSLSGAKITLPFTCFFVLLRFSLC